MRIVLESNFDLGGDSLELAGEQTTLGELLMELGQRQQPVVDFLDRQTGDVDDLFVISINGREYTELPGRLNVPLQDGDRVRIDVAIFGGGQGR